MASRPVYSITAPSSGSADHGIGRGQGLEPLKGGAVLSPHVAERRPARLPQVVDHRPAGHRKAEDDPGNVAVASSRTEAVSGSRATTPPASALARRTRLTAP